MLNKAYYEERILNEVRLLPEVALPRVAQWLSFLREEFIFFQTSKVSATKESIRPTVEEIMALADEFVSLPVLDGRTPDEILGYDKSQDAEG
ncbi:MAG: hypothetical protein BWK78_03960 [Thiotrichaceae bacterium IS1]|jgi:hypothetical protein|nr:MAG: hypothetical protein BWK78_03960 [Thiotrichaceae bacterium IS1]